MLSSDLSIDASKCLPSSVSPSQAALNEELVRISEVGPQWWEVGAEKYRVLRREGKTPLPGPTVLDAGKLFLIPSRERQRDIPCRLMLPEGDSEIRGVYMHIHGGGWVLQSEADYDPLLKSIADGARVAAISIGYRLAPEHPFPSGPEDCYDAALWLLENAEARFGAQLKFVGGESAGGHLSVLTAFHLLEKKPSFKLAGLVLNYGVYDLTSLPLTRNFPRRLVLTPEIMARFTEAFTPGLSMEDRQDPSISPFYTDLTGLKLPPALFNCGTEDCLLEDTVMMALRWQMAGAETITKLYPGAPHGFVSFPPEKLPNAKECLDAIQEFLCQKLL